MTEVIIKQHAVSLTDEYEIYTDGKRTHTAYKELLKFYSTLVLSEYKTDRVLLKTEKTIWPFGPHYYIYIKDRSYLFETKSWLKGHYRCKTEQVMYDVYAHRGNLYRVFKNDIEIATWTGNAVTLMEGDKYRMVCDDKKELQILMGFCLIIDQHYYNNKAFFRFNLGPLFKGK